MSRIGKQSITIPAGVTVSVADGNVVTAKGPKGTTTQQLAKDMTIKVDGNTVTVERPSDDKDHRALHGLTRTLLHNMVIGVSEGFSKSLVIQGTGYRATMQGKKLVLTLGFSHPVEMEAPEGVTIECPSQTSIVIHGADKQVIGQFAAEIRGVRPPEPYHGKGVRYEGEHVALKEGKSGKK
ncbi:MAG: 50S ribosomal protein L6 [Clostridia bacterium]|nr:50S ribosomal protein L6 [Clostridia bacterium]